MRMEAPSDAAMRFPLGIPATDSVVDVTTLVDGGVYDIRRVAVGPHRSHGPGRHHGDACVCVVQGSVEFTVDGRAHALTAGDLLWVPADASRGFAAGGDGAALLAIHLPRGGHGDAAERPVPSEADQSVIDRVSAHHTQMSDQLDRLTDAVAASDDLATLRTALCRLVDYWRGEVVPHAAAEETTIYTEARGWAGAATLVEALVLEHQDLRARVRALQSMLLQPDGGSDDPTAASAEEFRTRAAMQAAAAAALFQVHARKENEVVLPALVAAGRSLPPILARMEAAFASAKAAAS